MEPLVSVVLPVYNAQEYLEPCIEALLAQSYNNLEIVAVNDGSTDRSGEMLDTFAREYPGRIKVIHTPNGGAWRARKTGVAAACRKYIAFCDSDDLPMQDMYARLTERAEETGADITVCPYCRVDTDTNRTLSVEMTLFGNDVLSTQEDLGFLPLINTGMWNKLYVASILSKAIDFESPPRIMEDMMLLCSIYPECEKIAFLDEPLYQYLTRKGSAMSYAKASELGPLIDAMIQTKAFVANKTHDDRFDSVCDLMAFIHFGISFPARLESGKDILVQTTLLEIQRMLNQHFPLYRKNPFCTLRYNLKHKNRMLKPMLALWFYRLHLAVPLIECYRFVTNVLHIEIKW